ncbi:MAG: DUF885 family protein [Thermoanaerobaculia bacterium]|nr:DUF885 family protein [Thermoanaerobaculia bacterium]
MAPRIRRLVGLLILVAATTAAVRWGLSDADENLATAPPAAPRPLTLPAYERLLAREAGGPIAAAELAQRASRIAADLEERLSERARLLDPTADDWRTVFARLREDTPADDAAVLAAYRDENARAEAFCRAHDLVPLPPSQPQVFAIANPSLRRLFPLAMNRGDGTLGITLAPPNPPTPPGGAGLENSPRGAQTTERSFERRSGGPSGPAPGAAYRRNHCRVCIPPIAVHESYPGHHVAFALARAGQAGNDSGRWPFFHEGWAQYAEILLWEEGYWQGDPAREMGALVLLLLRALRAEIDARLHGGRLTPEDARRLYTERLLMDTDAAASEVSGHLQHPTKKASYLVGALQVLALRDAVAPARTELRRFHERLLAHPGYLPALARDSFGVEIPALPDRPLLASP